MRTLKHAGHIMLIPLALVVMLIVVTIDYFGSRYEAWKHQKAKL